jgi:glycerol-3-phosphate acyltransferase PlsY
VSLLTLLVAASGYLFGSVPTGYLIARAAGIDIRTQGSGNIGATNVLRTIGKKYGYTVFLGDALKGFIAVLVGAWMARQLEPNRVAADWFRVLAALTAVLGHAFPVWLGFRGGKGVATSAGAMIALAPLATLLALLIWLTVFEATRYVSLASLAAAVALPVLIGIFLKFHFMGSIPIFALAVLLAVIVCWRHRSNMVRLVRGEEQRFTRR